MENSASQSTNSASMAEPDAEEVMRLRVLEMRKLLDLIVHVFKCESCSFHCVYPNCGKLKVLILHVMKCETRASGGCLLCKKLWWLLKSHAQVCKQSHSRCPVPHCRTIKEFLKTEDVNTTWRNIVMEKIIEEDNAAKALIRTDASDAESSTNNP